jgi:hypothetical protein
MILIVVALSRNRPSIRLLEDSHMLMGIVVCITALLIAVPVAAQQATPQPPVLPESGGAQEPDTGPKANSSESGTANGERPPSADKIGGQGSVGMGTMDRPRTRDADDDDDNHMSRMRPRIHGGGYRTPMQVIINIGPENSFEVEEHEAQGSRTGPKPEASTTGSEERGGAMADGVETRLIDLRKELQLTPEQQPAWNRFASAVLAGAVRDAVARMQPSGRTAEGQQTLERRLNAHEAVLTARLDAVRTMRGALSDLTGALSEAQQRTLDEHATAFVPGMTRRQAGRQ